MSRRSGFGGWLQRNAAAVALMVAAGAGISAVRSDLSKTHAKLKLSSAVWTLPAPQRTRVLSLGYGSAMAGVLYAQALVAYGQHLGDKRRFTVGKNYFDTINVLAPKFRDPYLFASTLLVLQTVAVDDQAYIDAREIMERGLKVFPYDTEIWFTTGQYIAFLGGPALSDRELGKQWRLDAAPILDRACSMVDDNRNIPFHCVSAATLYSERGERKASIKFLRRQLSITDDPEMREKIEGYLRNRIGAELAERAKHRFVELERLHQQEFRFVTKDTYLVLGPPFDPALCSGPESRETPGCQSDWTSWGELVEPPAID